jgi:hypothetical protein
MAKTFKQFIVENAPTEHLDENIGEFGKNLVGLRDVRRATDPSTRRIGGYVLPERGEGQRDKLEQHIHKTVPDLLSVTVDRRERAETFPGSSHDPVNPINLPAAIASKAMSLGLRKDDDVDFHLTHHSTGSKIKTDQAFRDHVSTHLTKGGIPHTIHSSSGDGRPYRRLTVSIPAGHAARIIAKQPLDIPHAAGPKPVRQVTESEKPFVAVKLVKAGGTSYTVVKSTHGSFKRGEKLSDSDYEELETAHRDGDVHFENLSKKGSGPGSKPGYLGRKSFRT